MYTLLTSIIPVSVTILLLHNWKLKKNLRSAEEISRNLNTKMLEQKNDEKIVLYATNKKDFISTTVSDFLYIESVGNYNVIYWGEKGEVMHKKIRNTLKNMEDQLLGIHSIMRVHKAFIVNLDQIQEINGNAQGYQLTMGDEKIKIPVSRTYMKKFIAKMAI
jgi:DNA-binding LytR/AlgR family response regulator